MNPLKKLQQRGQSIWLDNIRRQLLTSGELARYISDLAVTGLTSNPSIFEKAIGGSDDYDQAIASWQKILHLYANTPEAQESIYRIADTQFGLGRFDLAATSYGRLQAQFPDGEHTANAAFGMAKQAEPDLREACKLAAAGETTVGISWPFRGAKLKSKGAPMGSRGVRMSLNMIAASKPKRRMGCKVTSQAASGVWHSSVNESRERTSWYSGR